jgi:hypothetical protein
MLVRIKSISLEACIGYVSGVSDTQTEILDGRGSSILMGGHSVLLAHGTDSNLCLLWVWPCGEQLGGNAGLWWERTTSAIKTGSATICCTPQSHFFTQATYRISI